MLSLMLVVVPVSLFAAGGSITTGFAPVVGDGSEEMGVGFNIEGTAYGDLSQYLSLGAKVGFNRWSYDLGEYGEYLSSYGVDVEASLSYLEISPVFRVNVPLSEKANYFFEPSSGFYLGIAKAKASYGGESETNSEVEPFFGLSLATGFTISYFEIKPAFKMVMDNGETGKWLALTAGVAF